LGRLDHARAHQKWFTPAPYVTSGCEIDLRPGGAFGWMSRSPEGEESTNVAWYLEVVEVQRRVWTTILHPGYRPVSADLLFSITAVIEMAFVDGGTAYTATAMHGDPERGRKHADLGFHEGWGAALDQLVVLVS